MVVQSAARYAQAHRGSTDVALLETEDVLDMHALDLLEREATRIKRCGRDVILEVKVSSNNLVAVA